MSDAEATAIRAAFDRGGELSAAVELRRLFPGVTDNAEALECARAIAAWKPLPAKLRPTPEAQSAVIYGSGVRVALLSIAVSVPAQVKTSGGRSGL